MVMEQPFFSEYSYINKCTYETIIVERNTDKNVTSNAVSTRSFKFKCYELSISTRLTIS